MFPRTKPGQSDPAETYTRTHLHRHVGELLPGPSNDVAQPEDGTQRVVSSVAAPQVGVVHPWEDVPPGKKRVKQFLL